MPPRAPLNALLAGALIGLIAGVSPSPANADSPSRLLAPKSVCRGQVNTSLSVRRQVRTMACMHRYARRKAHRPGIRMISALRWSARRKAADILSCQELSHTACGRAPFYWISASGFLGRCNGASENIILGSGYKGSVRETMRGWLRSPKHRKVILRSRYRLGGIGLAKGTYHGYPRARVWVAHLGYRCQCRANDSLR